MATETGEPPSARGADGAASSPRPRSNCAQASGSVAGPARSTSGGMWTRTTDATRSGTTRSFTVTSRSPATSTGTPVRWTIRRCFRWSGTFWLRRRSMARCCPTIRSRGSSSRTGCAGTWITPGTSPQSLGRTARDSGSRGGSRCISRASHLRPGSSPDDPRPKACTYHPTRSTPDHGRKGRATGAASEPSEGAALERTRRYPPGVYAGPRTSQES